MLAVWFIDEPGSLKSYSPTAELGVKPTKTLP
ncbi:hypothetical protein BURPS1710b_2199 [Burkholderia pseudomallei 1710b]|uniref:Uncharacterized protein n=1 Tax=Burkholderia pseudomallei (strain 1710b) TaxID=320372 RepID=Q3JS58_BURP1|nr:hypothetical protein BURPS1710b_2199 [Burkholderia pseudomallei 1710b]